MKTLAEKLADFSIKQINKVGENFGWQVGKIGANWENGFMNSTQKCKEQFRKKEVLQGFEDILKVHIGEFNKKIETNADRVRNMNDEELEAFIQSPCSIIRPDRKSCRFLCDECIAEWLKEKEE